MAYETDEMLRDFRVEVAALKARIAELEGDAALLEPGLSEQVTEQRDRIAALEGALAQAVAEAQLHTARIAALTAKLARVREARNWAWAERNDVGNQSSRARVLDAVLEHLD